MPNAYKTQTPHLGPYGDPDKMNDSALTRPGELGTSFEKNTRSYQLVQLDSGCTASNTVGVVAAKQVAFWKDKDAYLVTNDSRQALIAGVANSYQNNVAGIFRVAVTAGYYCCILQRGDNINIKETQSGGGGGQTVIARQAANTAEAGFVALGTAPTHQRLGIALEAGDGTDVAVDVNIDFTPAP